MARTRYLVLAVWLVLFSCSNFKVLEPKPLIDSKESGFIELKDDGEWFELSEGKKYVIHFAPPALNDFNLVVEVSESASITTQLTENFKDDAQAFEKINNESQKTNRYVYPVHATGKSYSWLITQTSKDHVLQLKYRYVPMWRYQFEETHMSLKDKFEGHLVTRDLYKKLGTGKGFESVNYPSKTAEIESKLNVLKTGQERLDKISKVIPAGIDANDPAFIDYTELNTAYKEEISFQENFLKLLKGYEALTKAKTDKEMLINNTANIENVLTNSYYPSAMKNEVKKELQAQLGELISEYDNALKSKNDASDIQWDTDKLKKLASLAGKFENEATSKEKIKNANNYLVSQLNGITEDINKLETSAFQSAAWPSDAHYQNKLSALNAPQSKLGKVDYSTLDEYKNYNFVKKLRGVLSGLNNRVRNLSVAFRKRDAFVKQINALHAENKFKEIIEIIRNNKDLERFASHYPDIDQRSVRYQATRAENAIAEQRWAEAEKVIENLHKDKDFISINGVSVEKMNTVNTLEEKLFTVIERNSKERVEAFMNTNVSTFNGINALYDSESFKPVHEMNFNGLKQRDLRGKQTLLKQYLINKKFLEFPEKSISTLYASFTKNLNESAVYQARAIVAHGNFYKGKSNRIKQMVYQSNTETPKTVSEPAKFMKLYTMPISNKSDDTYTYVLRLEIDIKNEKAKFPVYDVNVKLPEEIGEQADFRQWYKTIKINDNLIKNEGRYTITSPNPDDEYKMQVTPVQVKKGDKNVFEIVFTHPKFKVFEVSTMLQRPLIKK